jgi:hypothetical protein
MFSDPLAKRGFFIFIIEAILITGYFGSKKLISKFKLKDRMRRAKIR